MQELEKILEEIKAHRNFASECGNFNVASAFELCVEIIRNHMNDGWIPVEERLPEDTKSGFYNAVSVTMSNGSVTHGCYRNADGEWWVAMEDGEFKYTRSDEVIAWSPLPESYCPERSDNHDRE